MNRIITKEKINKIKGMFNYYKNKGVLLGDIANKFKTSSSTVSKIFNKEYGDEFKKLAKYKSYEHSIKVNRDKIFDAFERYNHGVSAKKIAKYLKISRDGLTHRFRNVIGDDYKNIAIERKYKQKNWKKASPEKIKKVFDEYKGNRIPLSELANNIGLAESSLIARFKNNFKEEYKAVAKSRRDERKVTKEEYIKAFEKYEKTPISLTMLANSLGVAIGSLRPRFIRLFKGRYHEVAKHKLNGEFLNKKGRMAEVLALEYLKIIGIEVKDVRKKLLLKNSLKRPDFIAGENFIEVKSYFVKYSSKRLKGYKEIIDSYLNKKLVDGGVLRFGIIISLGGFSDTVWKKALEDGIALIDYNDLKRRFEENKNYDLINLMENHFLPR